MKVDTYKVYDEEGDLIYVAKYIHNPCHCVNSCNADELELYEPDERGPPYRLKIEGSEMKWLIGGLLDGDYVAEKTSEALDETT